MKEFNTEERLNIFNYVENYPYKIKILPGFIVSHVKNEYFDVVLSNYFKKVKTKNKIKVSIDLSKFEIRIEWSVCLKLHENKQDFFDTIELVAQNYNLDPSIIEKDY